MKGCVYKIPNFPTSVVFLMMHDKFLIASGDESFKFLTYELSVVGYWPTMEVTGNRDSTGHEQQRTKLELLFFNVVCLPVEPCPAQQTRTHSEVTRSHRTCKIPTAWIMTKANRNITDLGRPTRSFFNTTHFCPKVEMISYTKANTM